MRASGRLTTLRNVLESPQQRGAVGRDVLMAALAGLGAAVAAGVAWGLIVKWTDHEWGIAAWGVGLVVGSVVAAAARDRRGMPFQAVSVACAVIGVLVGKYLEVAWTDTDLVKLGILSSTTWDIFTDSDAGVWSWFDLVWFAAAVFSAFRIPGIRQPAPVPPEWQTPPRDEPEAQPAPDTERR
jgi:MFS family permease